LRVVFDRRAPDPAQQRRRIKANRHHHQFGTNTLGNLTYSYDRLGRRTLVGGSFARTGLPAAIASATYDAANELTNWNGANISYDANGNMLAGGGNTFTWNARNQVATLNGVALQYDAFGRRIKNASGTSFFYDGANVVQELSGSTVTANLLSGGIDEVFKRTDSSGAFTQLKDALSSTIALADSNGNVQTSYTYDPFGNTSVTGTVTGNKFQYTGRENEGGGLYYYRARYYSSLLGRFVSEDPMRFVGGINFYSYVEDSPLMYRDPSGNIADDGPPPCNPLDCVHSPEEIQKMQEEWERRIQRWKREEQQAVDDYNQYIRRQEALARRYSPPPKSGHGCLKAYGETAVGALVILGDIAFAWYVLPEILGEEGTIGLVEAVHGSPAAALPGVPGVLVYVDGLKSITQECY